MWQVHPEDKGNLEEAIPDILPPIDMLSKDNPEAQRHILTKKMGTMLSLRKLKPNWILKTQAQLSLAQIDSGFFFFFSFICFAFCAGGSYRHHITLNFEPTMVNLSCQLDKFWSHLGGEHLTTHPSFVN